MAKVLTVKHGHQLRWNVDGSLWGESVSLGLVWVVGGELVDDGVEMLEDQFTDVIVAEIDGETVVVEHAEAVETYEALVTALIRTRYTIDAELALAANVRSDPEGYAGEDAAFQAWREKCKAKAREIFGLAG